MSNASLIDVGICPPPSLKIRAHRIHSCTDIQFDRDLIGILRLNGNIPPGPIRTFLHTDGAGLIAWKTFDQEDIPAGADGDYLQTIAGLVQWAPPTFAPAAIAPGTARQLLQTNTAATAAEWTSNVDIPGTLDVTSTTTLDGNLVLNGASGTAGQVIRKTGATTQTWANVTAGDLTPGTTNQVLVTNPSATAAVWSDSLALAGSFKVAGTAQTQGSLDIQDNLFLNTVAGTAGQYIKKTGATTQAWSDLDPADITPGTANQVLQTDPTGTTVVWNSNVVVPGTISTSFNITGGTLQSIGTINSVNGGLTLSNVAAQINMLGAGTQINCGGIINTATLNMTGALQFSAVSGTLGAVPVSNALGIPSWSFPTYFARYYDNSIVNMNSGGGTTLLTAATADVSNANITYLAGTFTLAEPGQYQVVFQTNPTSVSAKAQSYVKLIVNGVSRGSVLNASAALNDVQSLSLIKTFRVNTTNAIVAIKTQQFVAGTLNTSGVDVDGIPTTLITITRLGPYV